MGDDATKPTGRVSASKESEGSPTLVREGDSVVRPLPDLEGESQGPVGDLPERYVIHSSDEGDFLVCRESPNIKVFVQRGLSVSGTSALKSADGTIFLDGAAQGAPFLDSEKDVYNLDHHEGCVRLFTLSTCEQAYIMIRKGLELRERDWKVLANEPDLDTVLAIWILLNHKRVTSSDDEDVRRKIVPLVRLEGLIDVHGMDLVELSCLPHGLLEETESRIAQLREKEIGLKKEGDWGEIDFVQYTTELLREVDRLIYSPWHFIDFQIVDELTRAELGEGKVAVICRSELGIYEVEHHLLALHEKRLGIVALQKGESHYTLKQVDVFLPSNLERIYPVLNLMDRAVTDTNRWGGSDIIGGSPRHTGTSLLPEEIAEAITGVFEKPRPAQILSRLAVACIATLACLIGGWTLTLFWSRPTEAFILGFSVFAAVCLLLFAQPYPRMYGVGAPLGRDWGFLFGLAVVGTALGGSWFPSVQSVGGVLQGASLALLLALLLPLSAEVLFRGVIHGLLAEKLSAQRARGKWFISWPVMFSTLIYAAVSLLELVPRENSIPVTFLWNAPHDLVVTTMKLSGLLLFGLACGMARERSESLIAPILFHLLTVGLLAVWVLS